METPDSTTPALSSAEVGKNEGMSKERIREVAQMLARLCEPEHDAGYGIYLDALRPLTEQIEQQASEITRLQQLVYTSKDAENNARQAAKLWEDAAMDAQKDAARLDKLAHLLRDHDRVRLEGYVADEVELYVGTEMSPRGEGIGLRATIDAAMEGSRDD